GLSSVLFLTCRNWFGGIKGGLGIATIGSSAVFAASSGSSVASTGTMGVIATSEMLKAGYSIRLAGGAIVAGGTLGILIPPSNAFILYGMITEESIGQLFTAGIIPGIMLTIFFIITILIAVKINPSLISGEEKHKASLKEKITSL